MTLVSITISYGPMPEGSDALMEEMDAELSRLWSEGTSVADIADHFGRKNSAIITRIKKLGL